MSIYVYMKLGTPNDNLPIQACNYTVECDQKRAPEDSSYTDYLYLRDDMRTAYAVELDLT